MAALLAAALFGAGVATGIVLDRNLLGPESRGPPSPDRIVSHFKSELNLNAEQEKVVQAALADGFGDARKIMERVRPEMSAAIERSNVRIRAVLTPEQAKRFDEMVIEFERRRGPFPPPPPDRPPQ
ncbi:MAG: hypothetical protein AB2A00_39835 [Myxococcota bacterium]